MQVDRATRAEPLPLIVLYRIEPASTRGGPEGDETQVTVQQCGQRDQPCGAGDAREDEAVEVLDHGSGEELTQRTVIALVSPLQGAQVGPTWLLQVVMGSPDGNELTKLVHQLREAIELTKCHSSTNQSIRRRAPTRSCREATEDVAVRS